jgi:hypothetical protein
MESVKRVDPRTLIERCIDWGGCEKRLTSCEWWLSSEAETFVGGVATAVVIASRQGRLDRAGDPAAILTRVIFDSVHSLRSGAHVRMSEY